MPSCLLHPDTPASAACEYCGQPHCAACLRPLLGRIYCAACFGRVQGMTGGGQLPVAPLAGGGVPANAPAPAARPLLPGWASALLYLLAFVALYVVLQSVWAIVIVGINVAMGGGTSLGPMDARRVAELMGPGKMGIPVWCALFLLFGWVSFLVILGFTALMTNWVEKRRVTELGLAFHRNIPRETAAGILLAALFFISVVGVGVGRGWFHSQWSANPVQAVIIALVGAAILLPFAAIEELSMRGYVFNAASRSGGAWLGVTLSTLAFAGLHAANPGFKDHPVTATAGLVLAGLYLASAYLITRSLWFSTMLHMTWNLMEGPVFGLGVSGMEMPASILKTRATGPELWTGGSFGPEAGLLLCLLLLVHLAALWALRPVLAPRPRAAEVSPA